MKKSCIWNGMALWLVALVGCGSPELSLPGELTVKAGEPGSQISATLMGAKKGAEQQLQWTLSPSDVGSLSGAQGASVTYTPPANLSESRSLTLAVILPGTDPLVTASMPLTVRPNPALTLTPTTHEVQASGGASVEGVQFTATVKNSPASVAWTLSGPGTLTPTGNSARYVPPETVSADTNVTITASVPEATPAQATVTVKPSGSVNLSVVTPAGVSAPSVTLTGPANAATQKTFQTSTEASFVGLAPGTYTLSAPPRRKAGTIVDEVYEVPTREVEVTANATQQTTAAYTRRPGSGMLWVPSYTSALFGYDASALSSSTGGAPAVTLGTPSAFPSAIAFDTQGNLWLSTSVDGLVLKFTAASLASSGTPTPAATIPRLTVDGVNVAPAGLAFDSHGNLWVADYSTAGVLLRYDNPQSFSGTVSSTANATVRVLDVALGIAFDKQGNLWASDDQANRIVKVTNPDQLVGDQSPTPAAAILNKSGQLTMFSPAGLAFDPEGNLWVASIDNRRILKYANPNAHQGDVTPDPDVIIESVPLNDGTQSLVAPKGITFDNEGSLWVANVANQSVVKYARPHTFSGTVSVAPDVVLKTGGKHGHMYIAFSPAPLNVPVQSTP